jgi:hypothetical protein
MTQHHILDLSHAGVDAILAAIADAGLEVHYNETDGDTALDIWLTALDATTAVILSWRDTEGWTLRQWETFGGDTSVAPDRTWPIGAGSVAEVARDVAAILADEQDDTTTPAEPDYWLSLADDIRRAADQVATLAGQPKPPYVGLGINVGDPGNKDADVADRVDAIAAAFGVTAETKRTPGGYYKRSARGRMGQLNLSFYGYVPDPEESELERLRAEVAELRAAQGGTR